MLQETRKIIAVPTGIEIFRWLATIYGAKIDYNLTIICSSGIIF